MSTKPNILIFIDWFWPGYLAGGPVQSIVSLVHYLNKDYNFKIVTTNCDLNSLLPYENIEPNVWTHSPLNCDVYYADPKTLDAQQIKMIIDSVAFDLVYINSFFSKNFSITPLRILNKYYHDKPVVFAPRGMLGAGALAIKRYKKMAFIFYAKWSGLHKRVIWHATSQQEEREIKKIISSKARISVVSNLPKKLHPPASRSKNVNELDMCFISRISLKKNLFFALQVLSKVTGVKINYSIYGPIEDEAYWHKCEAVMAVLPSNIAVTYKGLLAPDEVEKAYASAHFLFLPTYNENFGHAIVEGLLCGCPAMISDQTPWNDLEANNAGYAFSLSEDKKFIDAITRSANMDEQEFAEKSTAANNYIRKKLDLELISNQYKALFNDCIKKD